MLATGMSSVSRDRTTWTMMDAPSLTMMEVLLFSSSMSHSSFSANFVRTLAARLVSSASRTVISMNSDPAWCLSSSVGALGDDFAEVDDCDFVG